MRLDSFTKEIDTNQVYLVTNPTNIRYLSGFSGSNGLLIIDSVQAKLITDFRYGIQAENEVTGFEVVLASDIWHQLGIEIQNEKMNHEIFIEAEHLTVDQQNRLIGLFPNSVMCFQDKKIEKMRSIKEVSELSLITKACEISVMALTELIAKSLIGLSEKSIATKLDRLMIDLGADRTAFETIVASGENSAIPHHQPTDRILKKNEFLKIDFGAMFQGYKSDCTRTFISGSPDTWQKEVHQSATTAQAVGREAVEIGAQTSHIDELVRKSLEPSGYLENFTHGLGHGVGLDIHEDPFLGKTTQGSIAKNMVITIEPGIYFPNRGGVRIEDTGVVTDSGFEVLTKFSYELIEIS